MSGPFSYCLCRTWLRPRAPWPRCWRPAMAASSLEQVEKSLEAANLTQDERQEAAPPCVLYCSFAYLFATQLFTYSRFDKFGV